MRHQMGLDRQSLHRSGRHLIGFAKKSAQPTIENSPPIAGLFSFVAHADSKLTFLAKPLLIPPADAGGCDSIAKG